MISVKSIDALLPQTQCGECGYPGCLPYAEALAQGKAAINLCPPGGPKVVNELAQLLNLEAKPYLAKAEENLRKPALALIREPECIGCTKCIQACPVDAIIGSAKRMHVILSTECTGCGLCVPACPVDCIDMHAAEGLVYDKDLARKRFNAKKARAFRLEQDRQELYRQKASSLKTEDSDTALKAKQDYIKAAMARVAAKKVEPKM
ncbi:MAG: RnfABCDGE type electron transport complex subunit B [Proteobacteria bacterium]|nr:RnfABCDGE type electron transport complex subunit B [Pseudomonadota bacterium]